MSRSIGLRRKSSIGTVTTRRAAGWPRSRGLARLQLQRSHTARTAGRLAFGDLLVGYERFQALDALHGEGHDAVFVFQAVDPD